MRGVYNAGEPSLRMQAQQVMARASRRAEHKNRETIKHMIWRAVYYFTKLATSPTLKHQLTNIPCGLAVIWIVK